MIANRGEVAVRIARTAREMSIVPVGITSEADRGAKWLACMEEVVCVGGATPRESYLRAERIVQAAVQTGCSALHPGWGFLAENPRFAALCEQHGVTFAAGKISTAGTRCVFHSEILFSQRYQPYALPQTKTRRTRAEGNAAQHRNPHLA
jgi:acetyl/propionyl-CoA carboxylase alpha subunit